MVGYHRLLFSVWRSVEKIVRETVSGCDADYNDMNRGIVVGT